jgi:flavin-dependent thymidylate synthase
VSDDLASGLLSRDVEDHDHVLGDAPFNKHSMNVNNHVSPLDQAVIDVGVDEIRVDLIQGIDEEHFRKTTGMAVRATIGIDPSAPPEDLPWEEMLKGGLQTALESQTVVFGVSGVSRTCTHQLVRTRKAAFHQQSQRASFMGERPNIRMPESVFRNPKARMAFMVAAESARMAYQIACEEDVAYQDARFILPEGTETYIMLEYPVREFLNVYAYRACYMFQWEIRYVMHEAKRVLVEQHPWLDEYIRISCERPHRCTFQGWESVEGHCPLPWAREDNRTYKPDPALRIGTA